MMWVRIHKPQATSQKLSGREVSEVLSIFTATFHGLYQLSSVFVRSAAAFDSLMGRSLGCALVLRIKYNNRNKVHGTRIIEKNAL